MSKILISVSIGFLLIWGAFVGYNRYFNTPEIDYSKIYVSKNGIEKHILLSELQGKITLIAFFQTWCIDCIKEMPTIKSLESEVKNPDFKVIMVTDEPTAKLEQFKKKFPAFAFDFYIADQKLPEFGIKKYPTTYLLNQNGEEIKSTLEGFDWGKPEILKLVKEILAN